MDTNNIQIFINNLFGELRVAELNGEVYFCLSDACRSLEFTNLESAANDFLDVIKRRNSSTTTFCYIPTTITHMAVFRDGNSKEVTQTVNMIYVNEAALFLLIFRSRKEKAVQFQDWVMGYVLPSIRKIGIQKTEELFNNEINRLKQQNIELQNENNYLINSNKIAGEIAMSNCSKNLDNLIMQYNLLTSNAISNQEKFRILTEDPTEFNIGINLEEYVNSYKHNLGLE